MSLFLQATFLYVVPPIVLFLAKHPLVSKYDLSSVQGALSGAAPVGADTIEEAIERLGMKSFRQGQVRPNIKWSLLYPTPVFTSSVLYPHLFHGPKCHGSNRINLWKKLSTSAKIVTVEKPFSPYAYFKLTPEEYRMTKGGSLSWSALNGAVLILAKAFERVKDKHFNFGSVEVYFMKLSVGQTLEGTKYSDSSKLETFIKYSPKKLD